MSTEEQIKWLDSIEDLMTRQIDKQAISSIKKTLRELIKYYGNVNEYNYFVSMNKENFKKHYNGQLEKTDVLSKTDNAKNV
jgi:transcription initiation factor IIE alpha subunit